MPKHVKVAGVLATVMFLSGAAALAQQGPSGPPEVPAKGPQSGGMGPGMGPGMMMGQGQMMGPGMMGRGSFRAMCNPRMAGFAEWRINRVEKNLALNDQQKQKLADLRSASAKAAETLVKSCEGSLPATSVERLGLMEKRLEAMLAAMKTVRPAFDAFYGSLDSTQKQNLDKAGPRRWGWRNWR